MDELIQYLPTIFGGLLTTIVGFIAHEARKQRAGQHGIVAILRFRLMAMFKTAEKQKYILPEEMEVFEGLYEPYKALGGNGIIDAYREKLLNYPTHPEKKEGTA